MGEVNLVVDGAGILARHACAVGGIEVVASPSVASALRHYLKGGSQSFHRCVQHCGFGTSLVHPQHLYACIAGQPNQMQYVGAVVEGKIEHGAELVDSCEGLVGL